MSVSVIVSTYRRPDALALVISSVINQNSLPEEIIVVDDGSDPEVREVLVGMPTSVPIRYVWQPDDGFRLARVRNLGGLVSRGDYLIFLDGDCVLPPDFICQHIRLRRKKMIVFGSRKLLSKKETELLVSSDLPVATDDRLFSGRKFLKMPLGLFRFWPRRSWRSARGFTLALYKETLLAVEGFDESYQAWGLEDSDFVVRCIRAGNVLKDSRYSTSCLHLWHLEKGDSVESPNSDRFERLNMEGQRIGPMKSCLSGIV